MKIDDMICALIEMRKKVGGNEEVPMVTTLGENDYIQVSYPIVGDFKDQDGNTFKCGFIGSSGGEEFTRVDTPHYEWKPHENEMKYEKIEPQRFDGYLRIAEDDLKKFPEPKIVDISSDIMHVKMRYVIPEDAVVNGHTDDSYNPSIPGYDKNDDGSIKWDIDVRNGIILNWNVGTTAKTYYKIVDCFEYDYNGFHYDYYVPDFMGIDDESYGDYVCITIDKNGKIENWDYDRFLKEHEKIEEEN